ncbi:unnamed protein product [Rotaria magnacalcarata]|uniref:Uncharacterized protein n=2 Tax=Rotaria magnacalcarata TaxID=392030 RepID=A0A819E7M5_9BILA|nr:unnamed protein product [Rotaria magnacalcarata]CAF3846171.1 unnamed protein product [Rotaria magnacalcarata]CAF4742067.1 unnamed protein product [Rotaria magnacalcarata]
MFFCMSRLRLNSLLATCGLTSDKTKSSKEYHGQKNPEQYPPLRQRNNRETLRSIRLKPQKYFLFGVAILAIAVLITYNVLCLIMIIIH